MLGILTIHDLLLNLPLRYIDASTTARVAEVEDGASATVDVVEIVRGNLAAVDVTETVKGNLATVNVTETVKGNLATVNVTETQKGDAGFTVTVTKNDVSVGSKFSWIAC